jgi:predicted nucleic acid-binding protein
LTVVVDSAFVVALARGRDERHPAARAWIETYDEDLVTSPLAVAEMDYIIGTVQGERGQRALWENLASGVYVVRWWADAILEAVEIARRHPWVGLTDASLVALAGRLRTNRILTFDDHFRSLTTPGGEPFIVLPADA